MLNCKQTSVLVSQSLDRPLTLRERWAVRLHLWICVYCRRFRQQLTLIRKQMTAWQQQQTARSDIKLPSSARQRIAQRLDADYIYIFNLIDHKETMMKHPLTVLSSALALSMASAAVPAAENPFELKTLAHGYQVADAGSKVKDGKCASGKCGASKKKMQEGSCSAEKMKAGNCSAEKMKEGSCSAEKMKEGACHSSK